jgi:hypothetical protein
LKMARGVSGHLGKLVGHDGYDVSDAMSVASGSTRASSGSQSSIPPAATVNAVALAEKLGGADSADLSLTQARGAAKTLTAQFLKLADGPKTSPPKVLRDLVQRMGAAHLEVTATESVRKLDALQQIVDAVKSERCKFANWTLKSSKEFLPVLLQHIKSGESLAEEVEDACKQLKSTRSLEVCETASGTRKAGFGFHVCSMTFV